MSAEITVHSYGNNGVPGSKPRKPLVHVMFVDEWRNLQSMHFHPADTEAIISAIQKASNAALRNRARKPTTIKLRPDL